MGPVVMPVDLPFGSDAPQDAVAPGGSSHAPPYAPRAMPEQRLVPPARRRTGLRAIPYRFRRWLAVLRPRLRP